MAPSRSGGRAVRITALVVGVLLLGLVVLFVTRPAADERTEAFRLANKPAPQGDRTFQTLDGNPVKLSDFGGKVVYLNFFASWCVPCEQEHPELLAFAERHQNDAVVVAVLYNDEPANARRFFQDRGGDWPVVLDPEGRLALDYGVTGPPTTFVIDATGIVRYRYLGPVRQDGDIGLNAIHAMTLRAGQ